MKEIFHSSYDQRLEISPQTLSQPQLYPIHIVSNLSFTGFDGGFAAGGRVLVESGFYNGAEPAGVRQSPTLTVILDLAAYSPPRYHAKNKLSLEVILVLTFIAL